MKIAALIVALVACHIPPTRPPNYAARYVTAIDPEATALEIDGRSVLVRDGLKFVICLADDAKHTACHMLIDYTPAPQAAGPREPAKPAPPPDVPPASAPVDVKTDTKSPRKP